MRFSTAKQGSIRAPPHNSAARLAMSFPPSAACKFLDLHPVNLRNLHLHLTKNPFASRPPHLRGVTLTCCFYGICLIGFFRCSRRVCGREVVPFWRARKEPKSAQRGLKRVQVWTSAPSGLPPPLPFLAGKSSGGCPACRHFPCAVFRVENTKFALVCAKRDSGTGTHAFSRLFAVLCILRNRTVNTAS